MSQQPEDAAPLAASVSSAWRFLLLQVRNAVDPMRQQEVDCFARALQCRREQIQVHDLLSGVPTSRQLDAVHIVLLGGSGEYSVAEGGDWLPAALTAMRQLVESGKPTFASCWGFQAMAKALGGEVVHDLSRAEIGSVPVYLTDAGLRDPLFATMGPRFLAQMGHQDRVSRLPPAAILLASSDRVENQAFRVADKPIYCTQFHPELNRTALLQRLRAYPWYVERIAGMACETFAASCQETPETDALMRRFVHWLATR